MMSMSIGARKTAIMKWRGELETPEVTESLTTVNIGYIHMHTNCGTGTEASVPRTSLCCSSRYGNSTRRWFAEVLGANHPLVHYRSGGGSKGHAVNATTTFIPYYLTRETGTRKHRYFFFEENLNAHFAPCPRMAINVSVQYYCGLLPDMILLTQCYCHRGTRLNAMKRFCLCSP